MRSQRSILALEWMPVSVAGGVRKALGGFLRYVEYRDQHLEPAVGGSFDDYLRYVAHRDRTSPAGRIFGRDGQLTDADRKRLVEFVARSTKGLESRWLRNSDGVLEDHQRAAYQMILSPEDWRGLDLRRMARVAMDQLERDAGPGGIGPWFAAEHRNTDHHHVHIVLAARREVAPGQFRTVLITRRRLQRMKDAIALEIERQRGLEMRPPAERYEPPTQEASRPQLEIARPHVHTTGMRWLPKRRAHPVGLQLLAVRQRNHRPAGWTLVALKAIARRYSDRMELELEREAARAEHEGWVR